MQNGLLTYYTKMAWTNTRTHFQTRNTFYGTRYLSHCCVLFCIKTYFL